MLFGLVNRTELSLDAYRDRAPNYVILSDGTVRNGYTLTVVNKANESRVLDLELEGDPAFGVRVLGADGLQLEVGPDQTRDFRIFLALPREAVDAPSETIAFLVTDPVTGETARTASAFQTGELR